MSNSSKNGLIVITGGTKGIGRALVERFCSEAYTVITCSRNELDLDDLQQEMQEHYPAAVLHTVVADLSQREYVNLFAEAVLDLSLPLDVLINNTGVFVPGQIQSETEGVLEQTMQTNVYSAYHLTRSLLPAMLSTKGGHIFNICSTASITAYTNGGSYCISKFALLGFSKVLRAELKEKGIRVTSVLPGATYTASWEGVDLPEERFMPAEDVAELIWSCWQLSPRSVVEEILLRPQLGDL
ncbi:SDR family oxidoreductase [Cesiribacter andamanensis]|uniref:Serine 3-dehydrogenase n=1 Tax=Cesiribacter andamanensis AMV16 TaxID=1279009 RepID=M7NX46_9BACT|nr:SDR family oxidoreductase [Cesiribacter andamanensis]EMR03019.1 Serine 3-dehydrogenase [Cesiribacter andamanensis AMV16]